MWKTAVADTCLLNNKRIFFFTTSKLCERHQYDAFLGAAGDDAVAEQQEGVDIVLRVLNAQEFLSCVAVERREAP